MARARNIEDIGTLQMALVGFQIEKQRIENRIQEIQAQLKGRRAAAPVGGGEAAAPRRRELSEAARKRIAMAQKRRWAEHRKRAAAAAKAAGKPQAAKASGANAA